MILLVVFLFPLRKAPLKLSSLTTIRLPNYLNRNLPAIQKYSYQYMAAKIWIFKISVFHIVSGLACQNEWNILLCGCMSGKFLVGCEIQHHISIFKSFKPIPGNTFFWLHRHLIEPILHLIEPILRNRSHVIIYWERNNTVWIPKDVRSDVSWRRLCLVMNVSVRYCSISLHSEELAFGYSRNICPPPLSNFYLSWDVALDLTHTRLQEFSVILDPHDQSLQWNKGAFYTR